MDDIIFEKDYRETESAEYDKWCDEVFDRAVNGGMLKAYSEAMDKKARSTIEMSDPASRPEIAVKRDNMKDYDTIFVSCCTDAPGRMEERCCIMRSLDSCGSR